MHLNKIRIYQFAVLMAFLIASPNLASAQSQGDVEQGAPTELKAITNDENSNSVAVTALITVKNKNNGRLLGGVKISVDNNRTINTDDPPPIGGYKLTELTSGKHEFVAERTGYEIYDENISVPSDKQYYNLEINLKPLGTTIQVNDAYFRNRFGTNLLGYPNNYSQYSNTTVTNPWDRNQNIFNDYATNGQTGQYYNSYLNQSLYLTDSISKSQTININEPTSKFAVNRSTRNGDYIIYNKSNNNEYRHMFFIDRANGEGGIVFFSADVEAGKTLSQINTTSSTWFVSTYSKDQYQNAIFDSGIFTRTTVSPQNYSSNLYHQLIEQNFTESNYNTEQNNQSALDKPCIVKRNINFCFTEDYNRTLAINGSLNNQLESIADRINSNKSLMKDKRGNPDFIVLSEPQNSVWQKVGLDTKAFACLVPATNLNVTNSSEACVGVINDAFSLNEINVLKQSKSDLMFMVIKANTDINQREPKIYIDHEWAHIYDYQSSQIGAVSPLYSGRAIEPSISVSQGFDFASIYNSTSSAAKQRFNELKSLDNFNIQETLKPYPYCIYGALTDYLALDPEDITGTEIKHYNKYSSFVVDRVQELFAYSYSISRDQKTNAFNQLFSRFGLDPNCATTLNTLQGQYQKLFNNL